VIGGTLKSPLTFKSSCYNWNGVVYLKGPTWRGPEEA